MKLGLIGNCLFALLLVGCHSPLQVAETRPVGVLPVQTRPVRAASESAAVPWNLEQIELPSASTGQSVVVAVLDTGIDAGHPAFQERVYAGIDLVGPDLYRARSGQVDYSFRDGNGHGTHVVGIILAASAGFDVRVLPVKVIPCEGVGNDVALARGIEAALAWRDPSDPHTRVQVINLSLSSPEPSERLAGAIRRAAAEGALLVAAAGNDGQSVSFPASMEEVLTVGGTGLTGERVAYSSFGAPLDLLAPAGDDSAPIVSAWPTYLTVSDWQAAEVSREIWAGLIGTSMAAPHVSAAAAVLWGLEPSLSAMQVRARILAATDDLNLTGHDSQTGYGRLNLSRALRLSEHDLH
ncbi:MAG: S8 family serine peptidase [Candidatus Sericytochromatia bacterium]|nr:S8 family serine peptidase [Candidatus Sericytochromatia bacterium]